MNRILLVTALCATLAIRCPVHAQLLWNEGEITLNSGITIRGELCYQPDANTLLFRMAGKWRSYSDNQLQRFHFVDKATNAYRQFTLYEVGQDSQGNTTHLIFEEIIAGVTIRLLQLPGSRANRVGREHGLPHSQPEKWQTPQPWYVWRDGRFVAPNVFVETELDALLMASPDSVQRWAAACSRPSDPLSLSLWLACYLGRMTLAKPHDMPRLTLKEGPN